MIQQTTLDKSAALDTLYRRFRGVAETIGGTASQETVERFLEGALVAEPRSEDVPALRVEMPGRFRVELAPPGPLSVGNILLVRARRTHGGALKSDWSLVFGPEGWRWTKAPLSDPEIRACLTPEGPPPRAW
jgi:hypothetical protein